MSEKIKPALSAEQWAAIAKEHARDPLGSNTSAYYDSVGHDPEVAVWHIAVNNFVLPDADPRKITRVHIARLEAIRDCVGELATRRDGPFAQMTQELAKDIDQLRAVLESYLPPPDHVHIKFTHDELVYRYPPRDPDAPPPSGEPFVKL